MKPRRRIEVGSFAAFLISGCYLSHQRPEGDSGPIDARVLPDAQFVDARVLPDAWIPVDAPSPAAALDGLRWELPCLTTASDYVCTTPAERMAVTRMSGAPGASYLVTLRLRGVVEEKTYAGVEVLSGHFGRGGSEDLADPWNIYALDVESPRESYHLNVGVSDQYVCVAIDDTVSIPIDAGSSVSLRAVALDGRQIRNVDPELQPIVVPGVDPAPLPYDGQFIQMDVLGVEAR